MEEQKVIRSLNGWYYGIMVFTLLILGTMYYLTSRPDFVPMDKMSTVGMVLQYAAILLTLIAIPVGLYLVKWRKPKTLEQYKELATGRIILCGLPMSMNIAFYYLFGCYQSMMWIAAISAIAWYFSKPTLGKMEQEMKPEDPNEEKY
jgi:hypothetical protein